MDRNTKSKFITDERAVSSLIGFILLFAIGIIAFSSYQAAIVPSQNAQVEYSHSQQIQNDFSEFHSNVVNAIEGNDERSTSFMLGTRYPSRLIALNPPPAAGTLSTTEPRTVELGGATVSNVCGGDTSRSLVYEPQYNEYQSAQSTVYEHSFVGTTFRNGQSFPQSQRLIQDDRVNLRLLTGDVSESRTGSFSVEINATPRYTHDQNITSLTIPSQFDNEMWETQILDDQANVDNVENTPDGVRIEFIDSVEVSCAVVGVNHDPAFAPPAETATETVGSNASLFNTRWTKRNGDQIENSVVDVEPGENGVNLTMSADERGTNQPIEDASVDFAIEGGVEILDRFEPQGNLTNNNGEQFLELDIANSATADDQLQVYTTAGDDSDVVTFNVTVPDPTADPDPTFDSFSATADGPGGPNNNIRFVSFDGSISNVDASGTIQIELEKGGSVYYQDEIAMDQPISNLDTGNLADERNVPVEIRITLFDADENQYEEISGTFTDNNQELTLQSGLN